MCAPPHGGFVGEFAILPQPCPQRRGSGCRKSRGCKVAAFDAVERCARRCLRRARPVPASPAPSVRRGTQSGLRGLPDAARARASEAPTPDATAEGNRIPVRAMSFQVPKSIGFEVLVNRFNRYFSSNKRDYAVSWSSVKKNLDSGWGTDSDSFKTNQLGHPVPGLDVPRLRALGRPELLGVARLHLRGQRIVGDRGGNHPAFPQRPDCERHRRQHSSARRCSACPTWCSRKPMTLPRFWREVGAAADLASHRRSTGLPSATASTGSTRATTPFTTRRLGLGAMGTARERSGQSRRRLKRNEAQVDFSLDYGLPGSPNYGYTRPFDYFTFQATASSANGVGERNDARHADRQGVRALATIFAESGVCMAAMTHICRKPSAYRLPRCRWQHRPRGMGHRRFAAGARAGGLGYAAAPVA